MSRLLRADGAVEIDQLKPMPIRPLNVLVVWLLTFCAAAIFVASEDNLPNLFRLRHEHAEIAGKVTRLVPLSHGQVEVEYTVSAMAYKNTFEPGHPVAEGESVRVYYSPGDPTIAVIAPPAEMLTDRLAGLYVISMLLSATLTVMIFSAWRRCSWA